MIYEKSCGAVVFDIHIDCPFVVVEYMTKGHVSLPKGHMEVEKRKRKQQLGRFGKRQILLCISTMYSGMKLRIRRSRGFRRRLFIFWLQLINSQI